MGGKDPVPLPPGAGRDQNHRAEARRERAAVERRAGAIDGVVQVERLDREAHEHESSGTVRPGAHPVDPVRAREQAGLVASAWSSS